MIKRQIDYDPFIEVYRAERIRVGIMDEAYRYIYAYIDTEDIQSYRLEKILKGEKSRRNIQIPFVNTHEDDTSKIYIFAKQDVFDVTFYVGDYKFTGYVHKLDRHEYDLIQRRLGLSNE